MEIIIIFISLIIVSAICFFIKYRGTIEVCSILSSGVALVGSIIVAIKVAEIGSYTRYGIFYVDALGAITMLIIGLIGFVTTIYSIQYLHQETTKNIIGFHRVKQFFTLLNIFLLAMFLAITASSPIFAWISIEATTLSTAFLISFYNKPSAIEGAWKYLIINSIGLILGFFGTLLYFTSVSSSNTELINWQLLADKAVHLDPMLAKIAFVFILIGYGTKIGLVPMHTWKPDAYSKAPAPLGALLSGALLPVAFTIVMKFKIITDIAVGDLFSKNLLIVFGILSIGIATLIMFNARNYKRLLAYSSIENAGLITLGFGLGGFGVFAATFHLIFHSCIKAILFFSSGNLLLKYNSSKINRIKGALSVVPFTSILFIIGFLILTGMPPFGIFFSKMLILSVGIKTNPIVTILVIIFTTIVFVGFLKHVTKMFFGKKTDDVTVGEVSDWLLFSPTLLLVIVFCLSFYLPSFLSKLINMVSLTY